MPTEQPSAAQLSSEVGPPAALCAPSIPLAGFINIFSLGLQDHQSRELVEFIVTLWDDTNVRVNVFGMACLH